MKYTRKLVILQKKAIQVMNKASYNESSSPLFAKSCVLKFQDLQNLQICRLMYDTVHGYLPDSVTSLFDYQLTGTYPITSVAVEVWWVVACGSQWWRVRACCHVHRTGSLRRR